jgi:hypothetical protein
MAGSSLSSEMESISSILLLRGGTRRSDLGIVSPGDNSNTHAVQEGKLKIKTYRNFGEKNDGAPEGVGGVHGGPLLDACGGRFVVFWHWGTGEIIRRVDVEATNVSFLSVSGHLVMTDPTDLLVWY